MDSKAKEGVGIIISEWLETIVSGWESLNSRILVINFDVEIKLSFIQVYAQTEDSNIPEKEEFYSHHQRTVDKEAVNGCHVLIEGDLNARMSQEKRVAHGSMSNNGSTVEV